MKTYDIYFSDQSSSDNKGFSIKTEEKAIHMAEVGNRLGRSNRMEQTHTESITQELKNLRTQKLKTQYLCSQE